MDWLEGLGAAAVIQVLATAIAFGDAHSVWAFSLATRELSFRYAVATTALGAALGDAYMRADRLVLPVIVVHVAINLVIEP